MQHRPGRQKIHPEIFNLLFYDQSLALKDIAKYFGVGVSALGSIRRRYNLPPRGWAQSLHPFQGRHHTAKAKQQISANRKGQRTGKNNPNWLGGKYVNSGGYRMIYNPQHPTANKQGYMLEHRYKMERYLNRNLHRSEIVHHNNHNRLDNRMENLTVYDSRSRHLKVHYPKGSLFGIHKSTVR